MTTADQDSALLAPGRAPLLSVKRAAEFLDVSDSTVRRLVRAGELQALRVGVQLRFAQEELERYAAARSAHSSGMGLPSDAMEVPAWAEDRVERWKEALGKLLSDPKQSQVVVIDRRGSKAFSILRPRAFQWGVNLWHSTALCLQSDAELRQRFEGNDVFVFEEMVQRGRDVEGVRSRLADIGLQARSIALIRRRSKFLEGKVADPHLYPIEDLDEQDYPEAAAFISRLFDYCEPPLDPEHILVSGELTESVTADEVRERLADAGIVGVVWNRQSIEDSLVAAVTIDRPQFFDTAGLPLPEGFVATWDGPCKIRIYVSADGRRITLSFIVFPTLSADRAAWEQLVDRTWKRYGAGGEQRKGDRVAPSDEELERAYVDVCTDLSVDLLRQAVVAGVPDTLEMKDVKPPRGGELTAFFGTKRGAEMRKQVNDALRRDARPQLRLPPKRPVSLFVDVDRPMSTTTDPEHAQRCIIKVLPSRHAAASSGDGRLDAVSGVGNLELLRRLRPLEEAAVSNGLDGLLDGVRAKPVNVVEADERGWTIRRGFIGSELGEDGPYDAREMRRTQALSLAGLHQWLTRLHRADETEIHVAKLLVNLVHDWGGKTRQLAIKPYPYKHGYMPGVDSKVPWRTEAPKYFLRELADAGMVLRERRGRSFRYSIPPGFDLEKLTETAELNGHERAQLKSLVRAYALVQERCKVNRRNDPGNPRLTGTFSDPLIVLSSARNARVAYACALFEVEDWVRTGRKLFEVLNVHGALDQGSPRYRAAISARMIPFAQAARFLFEKIAMYEAVPELRGQLVQLFEEEGIDAGDILLETIDMEAQFAQSYNESDHPVGLLRAALPVLRGFSSFVRWALCDLGLQDDTRPEADRQTQGADGTIVKKDVAFYAERLIGAGVDATVAAAARRAVEAVREAGDEAGEQRALTRLDEVFELIVQALDSQIQQEEDVVRDRRRRTERYGDLIGVAKWLADHPSLKGGGFVAVGDFYNFMNTVGRLAEVTGSSDIEIAGGLQDQMNKSVGAAADKGGVIASISSDTCVLAAGNADDLLAVVEDVNEAFRVELSWDKDLAAVDFMRFGVSTLEPGLYLDSMTSAMKLGDKSGFRRGTIAVTPAVHAQLCRDNAERFVGEENEHGHLTYRYRDA